MRLAVTVHIDRVSLEFSDGKAQYLVANNVDAIAYIANHNCVEFHLLTVDASDLWHPDRFDPATSAGWDSLYSRLLAGVQERGGSCVPAAELVSSHST